LESDRAAAHWDPALLPVLEFDPLPAIAGGVISVPQEVVDPVPFRSRADLFDENDREMGEMILSGEIRAAGDGIEVAGQLLRCETQFELGEEVARVGGPSRMAVFPAGANRIVMARRVGLSTRRGN